MLLGIMNDVQSECCFVFILIFVLYRFISCCNNSDNHVFSYRLFHYKYVFINNKLIKPLNQIHKSKPNIAQHI